MFGKMDHGGKKWFKMATRKRISNVDQDNDQQRWVFLGQETIEELRNLHQRCCHIQTETEQSQMCERVLAIESKIDKLLLQLEVGDK